MNKCLKDQAQDTINESLSKLDDVLSEVKDIENNIEDSNIDFNFLYKYIDNLKDSISNIDDRFYDFINECDDIHDSISKLLGKVGN